MSKFKNKSKIAALTAARPQKTQTIPRIGSVAVLDRLLADYAILSFQALSMHWNLQGPEFISCHEFFEKRYQRLTRRMDDIAERIRALGAFAPAGFSEWMELSDLEDIPLSKFESMSGAQSSVQSPIESYIQMEEQVRQSLIRTGLPRVEEVNDSVSEDLLVSCLKDHEKTLWILKALLVPSGLSIPAKLDTKRAA